MNNYTKDVFEQLINEVLDDIELFGEYAATCVFYEERDNKKYYIDYELAEADKDKYLNLLDFEKRTKYEKIINAEIDKGNNYEIYNIIYDDEKMILVNLAELFQILMNIVLGQKFFDVPYEFEVADEDFIGYYDHDD